MGKEGGEWVELERRNRQELAAWERRSNARPLGRDMVDMSVPPSDPKPCACPYFHTHGRCKVGMPLAVAAKLPKRLGGRVSHEIMAARVRAAHDRDGRDSQCWQF